MSLHNAATLSRMNTLLDRANARLAELASLAAMPMEPLEAAQLIGRLHDMGSMANRIAHVIAQASINNAPEKGTE